MVYEDIKKRSNEAVNNRAKQETSISFIFYASSANTAREQKRGFSYFFKKQTKPQK